MKIPIENIYYLLLYAWKHVQRKKPVQVSGTPETELCNLFGHVLAEEAARLIARGLERSYVTEADVVAGIRGKLDVTATVRRNLLTSGRTICIVDELQHDVLRNQIVKATLRNMLRVDALDAGIRERIRRLHRKMDDVSEIHLSRRHFQSVQGHRQAREYDFILKLCLLILDSIVVEPGSGRAVFTDFREDEARMWQVFEDFVREFYDIEQTRYDVSRPQIDWHCAQGTTHDLAQLPVMRTDLVLTSAERCVILDAKFYPKALHRNRFGSERLHSSHLYQIFTYLENRTASRPHLPHDGILLYPVVEAPFAFTYKLAGHPIAVRSINLARPWDGVHRDMLELLA